jgi:hypothetical protein
MGGNMQDKQELILVSGKYIVGAYNDGETKAIVFAKNKFPEIKTGDFADDLPSNYMNDNTVFRIIFPSVKNIDVLLNQLNLLKQSLEEASNE